MSFEANLSLSIEKKTSPGQETFRGGMSKSIGSSQPMTHLFLEHGIIGFGNQQEYVLSPTIRQELAPLHMLVHARDPNILFFLVKFEDVNETLSPALRKEIAKKIDLNEQNIQGFYLVTSEGTFPDQLTFSINKRAPLFVDIENQKAGQYVLKNQDLPLVFILNNLSHLIRKQLQTGKTDTE